MKIKSFSFPYFIWMVIFIVVPLILVVYLSFTNDAGVFTLENYRLSMEPIYLKVLLKSVWLAFLSTVICFILGYPISYILANSGYKNKTMLLFLFVVPMWMNFLLRTYAWLTLLENNGIINELLSFFGFSKRQLLYTDGAVLLGMVYNFLPFMILPIHTALTKIDKDLVSASMDLGGNNIQTFLRVIFPLSMPGVISGVTMVFMPALTTFIIPELLGGGQYFLIGNLIEQQFLKTDNWNFGAALSMNLIIFIILFTMISGKDDETGGESLI